MTPTRIHGGTTAQGAVLHDFSTNSNPCGPCPAALQAVQAADVTRYPDPHYIHLRAALAAFHQVTPERIVLAGSASEFIGRISAWQASRAHTDPAARTVYFPSHAYGDYAYAASAWGLSRSTDPHHAALVWACEPSSPQGLPHNDWPAWLHAAQAAPALLVLDLAYAPLRLSGEPSLSGDLLDKVWQLYTPNKALGLTGVRGAYAVAPLHAQRQVDALQALEPSWLLGAHAVAMLQAWARPAVQDWLVHSLQNLRHWKARQVTLLESLGWQVMPSETHYFCARPPQGVALALLLDQLHASDIQLRDAQSFGLPGWVRLSVQPPLSQDALRLVLIQKKALDRVMSVSVAMN